MTNTPIDYASLTDEALDAIIKAKYPSSDTGFGAIVERQRREIKKPHWSVTPGFVVGVVAMVASCLAAYASFYPVQAQKFGAQALVFFQPSQQTQMPASNSQSQLKQSLPLLQTTPKK